jgi:signal transduction histidine kinase
MAPMALSDVNRAYLDKKLRALSDNSEHVIHIKIAPDTEQLLYYEDSTLLKRLSYFPYVQLLVMIVFLVVVYFAVLSTKKAEQNKVWVGLSKETAHQLGTPISSLMAWMELLPDMGVDDDTCAEMNKDVKRLSTIASRFSKIGSKPQMELDDAGQIVRRAAEYMATRISPRIEFKTVFAPQAMPVQISAPLFEWVMENLIKNAVDAMEGHGKLTVITGSEPTFAYIEVSDTGKGIARKNFNNVFNPGFTTKKRGWGLGLTLAKRIIEQYHRGHIFVKTSAPGVGTTFRIELPLSSTQQ